MLKDCIKYTLFFWITIFIYKVYYFHSFHFTPDIIRFGIIGTVAIWCLLIRKINIIVIISSAVLCWLLATNAVPFLKEHLLIIMFAYAAVTIFLMNFTALIILSLFILNTLYAEINFHRAIHKSPQITEINQDAYEMMKSKVSESVIKGNKEQFLSSVNDLCNKHQINPVHVLFVMWIESTINPAAVNPVSNATGLIQFMPQTSITLNEKHSALRYMTGTEQLNVVDKYLTLFRTRLSNCDDVYKLYLVVFYPAALDNLRENSNFVFPQNVVRANQNMFGSDNDYNDFRHYVDKQMLRAGINM